MERSAERARSRKKRNQDRGFYLEERARVGFVYRDDRESSDDLGLGDEGNDAKLAAAGTEGVGRPCEPSGSN